MPTVYVDPTAPSGGDGQLATPYNTWASVTFVAGDFFLQREGTTFNGSITCNVSGTSDTARVNIGIYDSSGAQITSKGRYAYINAAGVRWAFRIGTDVDYITISNFDVYGPNTASTNFGMYFGDGSADNNSVLRCKVHDVGTIAGGDCNGLRCSGNNFTVEDCIIYNIPDDGIWVSASTGPYIRRNHISGCAQSGRNAGDCIQLQSDCSSFIVEDNYLDHGNASIKQAFICSGASSGSGGQLLRNTCILPIDTASLGNACIYVDQPNCVIRGNKTYGGQQGIVIDAANNAVIEGNVIDSAYYGMEMVNSPTGVKVRHNLVMNCNQRGGARGGHFPVADTTTVLRNNIWMNSVNGCVTEGTVDHDYGCYFNNTSNWTSSGGGGAIDTNAVLVNPTLNNYYMPTHASVIAGGSYVAAKDFYGKDFKSPPTIGAVQRQATSFSIASRSVASRSITSRVLRTRTALT